MTVNDRKHLRTRAALVGIVIGMSLIAIGARAVQIQVFRDDWLSKKAVSQVERSQVFRGQRGGIYDAKMREMAISINGTSVAAYPRRIPDAKKPVVAKALARTLDVSSRKLRKRLAGKSSFVWVKRHVVPKQIQVIQSLGLTGVDFVKENKRFYPLRTLASQVLGFSGLDENGLEGIEFFYDRDLRGKEVEIKVMRDALGRNFDGEEDRLRDFSGNNLILTIDSRIQYIAEKALEEAVTEYDGKTGIAIVMSPQTGGIWAMAQYPFFNPNSFGNYNRSAWRNRAITDPFEPGSTMKIFSAAAAVEHGNYSINSIFYCEDGAYRVGGNTVHDTKKHGWLSLQQIVKYSSNIGAVKLGEIIGEEALYRTLRKFGFGEKTGIDCPGETSGSLSSYKNWKKIDAATIAFGQGIAASAIQLVTATAAIANDGVLMKPYIVQAVTDRNGRLLKKFEPVRVRRAVSMKTARAVNRMMQTVVTEGGTGTKAALEGYTVAGKTGTAQKIDETGRYSKDKYVAAFVGFAPAENPAVAILVVVDEPVKKHYGGTVSGPAFAKIAQQTLDYLNVSPKDTEQQLIAVNEETTRI